MFLWKVVTAAPLGEGHRQILWNKKSLINKSPVSCTRKEIMFLPERYELYKPTLSEPLEIVEVLGNNSREKTYFRKQTDIEMHILKTKTKDTNLFKQRNNS